MQHTATVQPLHWVPCDGKEVVEAMPEITTVIPEATPPDVRREYIRGTGNLRPGTPSATRPWPGDRWRVRRDPTPHRGFWRACGTSQQVCGDVPDIRMWSPPHARCLFNPNTDSPYSSGQLQSLSSTG